MPVPIVFLNPDSEEALEAFSQAIGPIPAGVPIVGLALKYLQTPEGGERLVNYEFADPDLLRSLALILSLKESKAPHPSKES